MKLQKALSPQKSVNRISFKKEATETIAPGNLKLGMRSSNVRVVNSSYSPSRPDSINLPAEFINSLNLAASRSFGTRSELRNWNNEGMALKRELLDHSLNVKDSRINVDLRKQQKLSEFLQLVKELEVEGEFDPLLDGKNPEQVLETMQNDILYDLDDSEFEWDERADEFSVPSDIELYTLSFDAVIDYIREEDEAELYKTLTELKQYFLQKLMFKPTQELAFEQANHELDKELLKLQSDFRILKTSNQELELDYQIEEQRKQALHEKLIQQLEIAEQLQYQNTSLEGELSNKIAHSEMLMTELTNSEQLLHDALQRCKRLSLASHKLKLQAEKSQERYYDAENNLNLYINKVQESEVQKDILLKKNCQYESEILEYKEKLHDLENSSSIEIGHLREKLSNSEQGMKFSFDSENLGKTAKLACETLVKLSRFSDYELEQVEIDRDGIGALSYLLDTIDNSKTLEKFLFAVKTDLRTGINVECQTALGAEVEKPFYDKSVAIHNKLKELKTKGENEVFESQAPSYQRINTKRRDELLLQNWANSQMTDSTMQCDVIEQKSEQCATCDISSDSDLDQEQVEYNNSKVANRESNANRSEEPQLDKYTRQEQKDRKKQLLRQQKELKKLMMETIEKENPEVSIVDMLEKKAKAKELLHDNSSESDNEMMIAPEKYNLMNEEDKLSYIEKYNDFKKEKEQRKKNILATQNQFVYKNETDFFSDNDSESDNSNAGSGFLNSMFSIEAIKKRKEEKDSEANSIASNSTKILEPSSTNVNTENKVDQKKFGENTESTAYSFIDDVEISNHEYVAEGLPYSRVIDGTTVEFQTVSTQTKQSQVEQIIASIMEKSNNVMVPTKSASEDKLVEEIQYYINNQDKLSVEELNAIRQITDQYIVQKSRMKQKGYELPETIETLDNLTEKQIFESKKETSKVVEEELLQNAEYEELHNIIEMRLKQEEGLINTVNFTANNSTINEKVDQIISANGQVSGQTIQEIKFEIEHTKQLSLEQKQILSKEMNILEELSQNEHMSAQEFSETDKQHIYQSVTLDPGNYELLYDKNNNAVGNVNVAQIKIPKYESLQERIQEVLFVSSSRDLHYDHDIKQYVKAIVDSRSLIEKPILERYREDLVKQGFNPELLEARARQLASVEADTIIRQKVEEELRENGEKEEEIESIAIDLINEARVGMAESLDSEIVQEELCNIQSCELPLQEDRSQQAFTVAGIDLADSEIVRLEEEINDQNDRISSLQLSTTEPEPAAEHAEQELQPLSAEEEEAPKQRIISAAIPQFNSSESEGEIEASATTLTSVAAQPASRHQEIVSRFKNSLYQEKQVGGIVETLAVTRQESENMRREQKLTQQESIFALSIAKPKLVTTAKLQDIEDLERAFNDAKQENIEAFFGQQKAAENAARSALDEFTMRERDRTAEEATDGGLSPQELDSTEYDNFLRSIQITSSANKYSIPENAVQEHPYYGAVSCLNVDADRLYPEKYYINTDKNAALELKYGKVQTLQMVNFYPAVVSRETYRKEWYESVKTEDAGNIVNATYQNYLNDKNPMVDGVQYQLCSRSLLPKPGDIVDYIRVSAITLFEQGKKPHFITLIESYSGLALSETIIHQQPYYKLPVRQNELRSLSWTKRTVKMLIQMRIQATVSCTSLEQPQKPFMETEIAEKEPEMLITPGSLEQQEYVSIAAFTLHYFKGKYGIKTLVLQLLLQLLTAVAFYEFEDDDVYLFARFLFDDLPVDFLLLYLEVRSCIELELSGAETEVFSVHYVPQLIHAVFVNFDAKRQFILSQELLQLKIGERLCLSSAISVILAQYSVFRLTTYRNCEFLLQHFVSQEEAQNINVGIVREFFEVMNVKINAEEFFRAGVIDLPHFEQFFAIYQLGRFAAISPEVLRGHLSSNIVEKANQLAGILQQLSALMQGVAKIRRRALSKEDFNYQQMKQSLIEKFTYISNMLHLAESDLLVYDCERALALMQRAAAALTSCAAGSEDSQKVEIEVLKVIIDVIQTVAM